MFTLYNTTYNDISKQKTCCISLYTELVASCLNITISYIKDMYAFMYS